VQYIAMHPLKRFKQVMPLGIFKSFILIYFRAKVQIISKRKKLYPKEKNIAIYFHVAQLPFGGMLTLTWHALVA
jgi:hypothetical protein